MEEITLEIPSAVNEPIRDYTPGSPESISLESKLAQMENESYDIPLSLIHISEPRDS